MRLNRFVFLNRPMLSLEAQLGVTASPQAPFRTDFVTLPVSASHRRFGSLPLAAEKGMPRYRNINSTGFCIPNMLKQLHPHAGGLCWLGVLYVSSICQLLPTGRLRRRNAFSNTGSSLMAQRCMVE
jgi:hypothetical protein